MKYQILLKDNEWHLKYSLWYEVIDEYYINDSWFITPSTSVASWTTTRKMRTEEKEYFLKHSKDKSHFIDWDIYRNEYKKDWKKIIKELKDRQYKPVSLKTFEYKLHNY